MDYTIEKIQSILNADGIINFPNDSVEQLAVDSRKVTFAKTTLFFALASSRRDGADFIDELSIRGVRNFVVEKAFDTSRFEQCNFLKVTHTLEALQQLASYHRSSFDYDVIGITGSNGKTIVKEWLNQMLHHNYNIVRSPRSYNSQIGVPLSVWQMSESNTLAIFEAGISLVGEMDILEDIIKPTIGIITNIGAAHSEGFLDNDEKLTEKLNLFKQCRTLIYCPEHLGLGQFHKADLRCMLPNVNLFSWSRIAPANLTIVDEQRTHNSTLVKAVRNSDNKQVSVTIPFLDGSSVNNAITCWCTLLLLGFNDEEIGQRISQLTAIEMRMEMKQAVNNCVLINDSYSNDLSSLAIALNYLQQQKGAKKSTAIISDIIQSGLNEREQFDSIIKQVSNSQVDRLILIGPKLYSQQSEFSLQIGALNVEFYLSTGAFLKQLANHRFRDEVILLKGARQFEFERISRRLEEMVHQTVMEINLNAMVHNLKVYQKHLDPSTKIMAMVKAFSYGSGSAEVANVLQYNKVDYLAVAYADEGVELRKAGIHMPIMVMNPEDVTFDILTQYDLEPELYSFAILKSFINYLTNQGLPLYPVHLKIDTGMHRLGFSMEDLDGLIQLLPHMKVLAIKSVFSHLVSSENAAMDVFTHQQSTQFKIACDKIERALGYKFLKHISNTAAIVRHADLQLDMVRLGIGLYGVTGTKSGALSLQPVATLSSTISQIKKVHVGDTVGYGRKGVAEVDSYIATIRIGYADGFGRKFSNGAGKVYVRGKLAPVIGNVCMDMTMIDITGIPNVQEGDRVEIFGAHLPVQQVAEWADTIAYEIMTGISQRVKRVYYEE